MIIFTFSYINASIILVFLLGNLLPKHWRDISVTKITFCCDSQSCSDFQHIYGSLLPSGIPDPEPKYLRLSLIYTGCCMHMEHILANRHTCTHT